MFEIMIAGQERAPKGDIYYLVAADGVYLVKKTLFFTSCVRVFEPSDKQRSLGWLPDVKSSIEVHLPHQVPAGLLNMAYAFFVEVAEQYNNSEAIVILYWNTKRERFEFRVPQQTVGRGTLPHYVIGANPKDCLRVGTIHSHGHITAFHSPVDEKDEAQQDGIHVTLGTILKQPTFACSVAADGERRKLQYEDVFTGSPETVFEEEFKVPESWMRQVNFVPPPPPPPPVYKVPVRVTTYSTVRPQHQPKQGATVTLQDLPPWLANFVGRFMSKKDNSRGGRS